MQPAVAARHQARARRFHGLAPFKSAHCAHGARRRHTPPRKPLHHQITATPAARPGSSRTTKARLPRKPLRRRTTTTPAAPSGSSRTAKVNLPHEPLRRRITTAPTAQPGSFRTAKVNLPREPLRRRITTTPAVHPGSSRTAKALAAQATAPPNHNNTSRAPAHHEPQRCVCHASHCAVEPQQHQPRTPAHFEPQRRTCRASRCTAKSRQRQPRAGSSRTAKAHFAAQAIAPPNHNSASRTPAHHEAQRRTCRASHCAVESQQRQPCAPRLIRTAKAHLPRKPLRRRITPTPAAPRLITNRKGALAARTTAPSNHNNTSRAPRLISNRKGHFTTRTTAPPNHNNASRALRLISNHEGRLSRANHCAAPSSPASSAPRSGSPSAPASTVTTLPTFSNRSFLATSSPTLVSIRPYLRLSYCTPCFSML